MKNTKKLLALPLFYAILGLSLFGVSISPASAAPVSIPPIGYELIPWGAQQSADDIAAALGGTDVVQSLLEQRNTGDDKYSDSRYFPTPPSDKTQGDFTSQGDSIIIAYFKSDLGNSRTYEDTHSSTAAIPASGSLRTGWNIIHTGPNNPSDVCILGNDRNLLGLFLWGDLSGGRKGWTKLAFPFKDEEVLSDAEIQAAGLTGKLTAADMQPNTILAAYVFDHPAESTQNYAIDWTGVCNRG